MNNLYHCSQIYDTGAICYSPHRTMPSQSGGISCPSLPASKSQVFRILDVDNKRTAAVLHHVSIPAICVRTKISITVLPQLTTWSKIDLISRNKSRKRISPTFNLSLRLPPGLSHDLLPRLPDNPVHDATHFPAQLLRRGLPSAADLSVALPSQSQISTLRIDEMLVAVPIRAYSGTAWLCRWVPGDVACCTAWCVGRLV